MRTSRELPGRRSAPAARPRVLHVLASLSLGGIETWLMHMLRHRDQFSVDHEVLLTKQETGEYEAEVRRMGVAIHKLPIGHSKRKWLRSLRKFLVVNGPYAAVHSHLYLFSAPVLAATKKADVPIRVAHCHTARSRGSDHQTLRNKLRRSAAIWWLKRAATRRIGISAAAIEEIAGADWPKDTTASVLFYGFDFSRFHGTAKRAQRLRRRLGIGSKAPIVGHVGRFEPVKNHAFLLDAFAALLVQVPEAELVLVGDGPLRQKMVAKATSLGITDSVQFVGTTDDIPAYMRMFDLFALTSFSEGLGIVCIEAQAAGTRSVISDAVAAEVAVVPGSVEFMPLSAGPEAWADAMAGSLRSSPKHQDDWLDQVETSRFAIGRCIRELDEIYKSELVRTR